MNAFWGALQALWILILLTGAGLVLQTDVVGRLGILGVRPDLLLAGLVILARRSGPLVGTLAGFAVGLMQDGLTPDYPGLNAAILCTIGFVCGHLRETIFWDSPVASALILFLAAVVDHAAYLAVSSFGHWPSAGVEFLTVGLPSAVYTAVAVPLVFYALPRVVRGRA